MNDIKNLSAEQLKNLEQRRANPAVEQPEAPATPQNGDTVDALLTILIKELKPLKPAYKQTLTSTEEIKAWKLSVYRAFLANGITTIQQIERGLSAAAQDPRPHWPSVGQLVAWCQGWMTDAEICGAFDRMIKNVTPETDVEFSARLKCKDRCRKYLSEAKAFEVFSKHIRYYEELESRGKPIPRCGVKLIAQVADSGPTLVEQWEANRDPNKPKSDVQLRIEAIAQRNRTFRKTEFVMRNKV